MKLVNATAVGTKRSLVHLNHGPDKPHTWEFMTIPVYPDSPDGKKLREVRIAKNITLRQAAKRLGISVTECSQLERGVKILGEEESIDKVIKTIEEHVNEH